MAMDSGVQLRGSGILLNNAPVPAVHGMGIGKLASAFSYTIENALIIDIAEELERNPEIQAAGVVDRTGKYTGIITRKKLLGLLSRPFGRDVLKNRKVSDFTMEAEKFDINENIFTISEKIADKVNSNDTYYFVLVNDKNEFCGIFSGKDMLVFLAEITRQDISLSRKIQTRIVREKDEFSGQDFELCSSSVMAKGIGGDFYSFKKVSDYVYLIVLCDVSGKGMAASLLSSLLSGFINTYPADRDLGRLISDLNTQLTRSFQGEKFVTGVFILFNEETGHAIIADMGHTHYFLFSRGKNKIIENKKVNIPLGISENLSVDTFNVFMKKKDTLLLVTDGIIEQKNEKGDNVYSISSIEKVFSSHESLSPSDLRKNLHNDFNKFKGKAARQDDVTFLILKYNPGKTVSENDAESAEYNIEDKIRWSLSESRPIQIKTSRYMPEDRDFIDSVLDRFLNEAGIKFLMNKISYCVHELATNAKKANTKRVYFKTKKLNINNKKHYLLGMRDFKNDTLDNIDYYLKLQKKMGFFILILFHLSKTNLKISVINNSEMTDEEKKKVKHKLEIAAKTGGIKDAYDKIEDYSEGAGLGIVMMSQMLRTMGFGPDVLTVNSEDGLTTSSITLQLRD